MAEKSDLRRRLLARRRSQSLRERHAAAAAARANLIRLAAGLGWRTVGCYLAFDGELDLDAFITYLLAGGTTVAVPVVEAADRPLGFAALADPATVVPGFRGVRQPAPGAAAVPLRGMDAIIVPGLAFDHAGTRLGHGLGCYDRTLAAIVGEVPIIGLCYDWQLLDRLPRETHDLPVDAVVTDQRCILTPAGPWAGRLQPFIHREVCP